MKISFFVGLVLLCGHSCYAQLEKGTFRLGGTIGLSKTDLTEQSTPIIFSTHTLNFVFNPNVSYFFAKRFSAGLLLPWQIIKLSGNGINQREVSYSAGPVLRYYFPFGKWAAFPEIAYSVGKQTTSGSPPEVAHLSTFRSGAGITYFLNKSIGIEGLLAYQTTSYHYAGTPASGNTSTAALGFTIGLQVYFSRKSD